MSFTLKKIIVPEYGTKFLFFALALCMWGMIYFSEGYMYEPGFTPTEILANNYLMANLLSLVFIGLNAFFIYLFTKNFNIIRTKTFIPIFVFVLTMTTWSNTHQSYYPHLTLSLVIIALHNLFKSYKNRDESHRVFIGTLLLSISSLINPVLLFYFPFILLGLQFLKSLSLRTFFATLVGLLIPWIIYLSILWFYFPEQLKHILSLPSEINFLFIGIDLVEIIYNIILLILLLIGLYGLFDGIKKDTIQTRNFNYFLIMMLIVSLPVIILFSESQAFLLPLLAFLSSIIISHPISLKNSIIYNWYFVVFVLLNVIFVVYNFIQ